MYGGEGFKMTDKQFQYMLNAYNVLQKHERLESYIDERIRYYRYPSSKLQWEMDIHERLGRIDELKKLKERLNEL